MANVKTSLMPALVGRSGAWILLALGLLLQANARQAPAPPEILGYEGFLSDASGVGLGSPNPTNLTAVFRVYDAATSGNVLWTEQHTFTVTQGNFQVMLGEGTPYASEPRPPISSAFLGATASERYIEVTVKGAGAGGADLTVLPRSRWATAPLTFLAGRSRTASALVNHLHVPVVSTSNGRVGILQSSPAEMLDVQGTVTARSVVALANATLGSTVTAKALVGNGSTPVGGIIMWSGSVPPNGWALCDGQVAAGIRTPDLRGRFLVGAGAGEGLTTRAPGDTGGEENHVVTLAEMPSHDHDVDPPSVSVGEAGWHTHEHLSGVGSRANPWVTTGAWWTQGSVGGFKWTQTTTTAPNHAHPVDPPAFDSGPAGGGQPHNNLPPFYVLAFIMRVQ